jgi:hypothetical protein
LTICNVFLINEISLDESQPVWKSHCIVSSNTQVETWRWPSARAVTCCLPNKDSTTFIVVFWLSYLYPHFTQRGFILNFYILNKNNISFQHITWFRKGKNELLSTADLAIYSTCWCLTNIIQINFKLELYSVQSWPTCILLYHPPASTTLQCIPFHFYLHMALYTFHGHLTC